MSNFKLHSMRTLLIGVVLPFAAFQLSGCSATNFKPQTTTTAAQDIGPVIVSPSPTPGPTPAPTPNPTPTPAPSCVPVADITRLTKILFLVDTSNSNVEWIDAPPTDPTKNFRLGSIQNFLNQYESKSNFQWGFITFANGGTRNYIAPHGGASFTADPRVMQGALNSFAQSIDDGDTPYGRALTAATNAIHSDKDRNTAANPQYFVVLITDGYPSDFSSPTNAKPLLTSLLGAAPTEVNLSTIFYGSQTSSSSSAALNMLSGMASFGGGQFANVNNPASGINISDVIPGHACP